jgi:hypothetical protein
MNLKVATAQGKYLDLPKLKVGDEVLCEDGKYYPVRSIAVFAMKPDIIRLTNFTWFYAVPRLLVKTSTGFKYPERYDVIPINKDLKPMVFFIRDTDEVRFCYDILIDGNMVSLDGVVFKFSS